VKKTLTDPKIVSSAKITFSHVFHCLQKCAILTQVNLNNFKLHLDASAQIIFLYVPTLKPDKLSLIKPFFNLSNLCTKDLSCSFKNPSAVAISNAKPWTSTRFAARDALFKIPNDLEEEVSGDIPLLRAYFSLVIVLKSVEGKRRCKWSTVKKNSEKRYDYNSKVFTSQVDDKTKLVQLVRTWRSKYDKARALSAHYKDIAESLKTDLDRLKEEKIA